MASKSIDLNDLHKLNPIAQIGLAAGLIAAILFLGYFLIFSGQKDELSAAQAEEETLKTDFESKAAAAAQLPALKKQLEEINTSFAILLKQLPTESEVPNLIQELHDAASANGMRLDQVIPQPTVNDGPIDVLPYQISVTGSHSQITQFTRDVGKLSRIITLSEINFAPATKDAKAKNISSGDFILKAKANTYKAVEAKPVAADDKDKKDNKKDKQSNEKEKDNKKGDTSKSEEGK